MYLELKDWMLEEVAETAFRQGQDLATGRIKVGYQKYHYKAAGYATLPDFVISLDIDDHKLLSKLAQKAFRNGFRSRVR